MKKIYLDNAATTFPKPKEVIDAMVEYMQNIGTNVSRGTYKDAFDAQRIVFEVREKLTKLFNSDDPSLVVFTKNITESINIITNGFLKNGDRVIISPFEHNSVLRPLEKLNSIGVHYDICPITIDNNINIEKLEELINEKTKLIIMTHASNVFGNILNLEDVGKVAKKYSIPFVVDAAQSAGQILVDIKKLNASAICFTGHKSLMGPTGIGGIVFNDKFFTLIDPLIVGGTGSKSSSLIQPDFMPDKFESGTQNIVGIFGLGAGLDFIDRIGLENIHNHEMKLLRRFTKSILNLNGIKVHGDSECINRTGVLSISSDIYDISEISEFLSSKYNIATRVGMHCSPIAHQTMGTYPNGTLRFSLSFFNVVADVDYAFNALKETLEILS
jgi:cysteine desulfurase family protein